MMRARAEMVGVLHRVLHEPHGRGLLFAQRLLELLGERLEPLVTLGGGDFLARQLEEGLDRGAALARQLAAAQVHRLDAVGAFVDLGDAGVADILAHAPFLDVAVAAENLLHIGGDGIALVGAVALDDRGQQAEQLVGFLALFLGLRLVRQVDQQRGPQAQRALALGEGLGVHQHPADIGMDEDRIGLFFRFGRTGQRAALTAVERVGNRVLVGDFGLRKPLDADAEPGGVHHHEHRREALVLLADHPAFRAVVVEHAGGVAVDAHLLLDRAAGNAVALAERTVVIDQHLGDHEQRDASRTVGRARRLCQHEVDDVLGQVVLAGRDEDLGAGDRIAAVALRFGLGPDHAKICPAMRLGQVHGAEPFARDHLGQVGRLLLVGTLRLQRCGRAGGEAGIHRERLVGSGREFLDDEAEHVRHALPAEFLRLRDRAPAAFAILLERFLEPIGRGHRAVVVAGAALLVADPVERREHFGTELARLVNDRVDHVGGSVLEARQIAVAGQVEHLVDEETRVAGRSGIDRHGGSLASGCWCQSFDLPRSSSSICFTKAVSSLIEESISARWRLSLAICALHFSTVTRRCSTRPSSRS